jgi:hypothetical protein
MYLVPTYLWKTEGSTLKVSQNYDSRKNKKIKFSEEIIKRKLKSSTNVFWEHKAANTVTLWNISITK